MEAGKGFGIIIHILTEKYYYKEEEIDMFMFQHKRLSTLNDKCKYYSLIVVFNLVFFVLINAILTTITNDYFLIREDG